MDIIGTASLALKTACVELMGWKWRAYVIRTLGIGGKGWGYLAEVQGLRVVECVLKPLLWALRVCPTLGYT